MSNSRKELQELNAVLLNIAEDSDKISKLLVGAHRKLDKTLKDLYRTNEEKRLRNELGTFVGEPHATAFKKTQLALDKINQEIIRKNSQITLIELKLKQSQERTPVTEKSAAEAKALQRMLNDLSTQNAKLLNLQKALQKQTYFHGQLSSNTDLKLAQQNLNKLESKITPILKENEALKYAIKANNLGVKMKTGRDVEKVKPNPTTSFRNVK